jgi:hypothetical protein
MFTQNPKTVLVRAPGSRKYNQYSSFKDIAKELWEYAALCENSYLSYWENDSDETHAKKRKITNEPQISHYKVEGASNYYEPLRIPGWKRWANFPSKETIGLAKDTGLYVEVMQNNGRVAVVFRGTEFIMLRLPWHRI